MTQDTHTEARLSPANYRELIALLRREGKHSGVWFADNLLTAADELEARAAIEALPARTDERALKLVEAIKTAIQHAYEEGVEDGSEWATDRVMESKPQWIDSVARVTSLQLARSLADVQPTGETR
jgi:hypothetical protein